MSDATELLTVKQAADLKKVHPKSVYRAIKEGRLATDKRGGIILLRRGDVDAWRARSGRYAESDEKG